MPHIEHHTEIVRGDDEALNRRLNELGAEGWTLVAVAPVHDANGEAWRNWFTREGDLDANDIERAQQAVAKFMDGLPPDMKAAMQHFSNLDPNGDYKPHN